jgi:hypothetical protein
MGWLEKFVLEESKKIAKEKSENSDDMRMLLRPHLLGDLSVEK